MLSNRCKEAEIISHLNTLLLTTYFAVRGNNSTENFTPPPLNVLYEQVEEDEKGSQKLKSRLHFSIDKNAIESCVNKETAKLPDQKPAASSQHLKKCRESNEDGSMTDADSPILTDESQIDKQEQSVIGQRSVGDDIPRNNLFSPILSESCVEAFANPTSNNIVSNQGDIVDARMDEVGRPIQMSRSIAMDQIVSPNFSGYKNGSIGTCCLRLTPKQSHDRIVADFLKQIPDVVKEKKRAPRDCTAPR